MKFKTIFLTGLIILTTLTTFGQLEPVTVAQLTIKIGAMSTEEMYYGFAEGDQIVFNFEEERGKELKEVEITELPGNSKFMDFKSSVIHDKKIQVHKEAVYKFRFYNSSLGKRVCRVTIQRIPKSEDLITFNTNWKWETLYDTTYVPYTEDSLVGHDTLIIPYTKKELVRVDTSFQEIQSPESEIWIYSRGNVKSCFGNSASCTKQKITLNYPINTDYLLVWIGVGQETRNAYNKLSRGVSKIAVKGGTAYLSGGSSLLAGAFTDKAVNSQIDNLPTSKNVIDIHFTDQKWADYWYNDNNNQISTFEGLSFKDRVVFKRTLRKSQIPKNQMVLCMKNNSYSVGTSVTISVVAVMLNEIYEDKQYTRQEIKPRYVKLNKQRMEVNTKQIRVNAD